MTRTSVRAGITVLALLLALARGASANCGAEGCPFSSQGPEALFGRITFGVRYQWVDQNLTWDGSGQADPFVVHQQQGGVGHVIEQETWTRSWLIDARARLTNRLSLAFTLPRLERLHRHALEHHLGTFYESEWHMTGLGDANAIASWMLRAPADRRSTSVLLQAGVQVPTGETRVEEINGEAPEPSARLGSGATDFLFGTQVRHPIGVRSLRGFSAEMPIALGLSARVNGRGTDQYRMGNEWIADASSAYPLLRSVRLLAQFDLTGHARDDAGNTDAVPHETGGIAAYASPGLQADLLPGLSAYGYYQFRLYQHTNGPQLVSPYHLQFGFGYSLR